MTAEIAILNRSAATLAADSAMTLSGGAADKTYFSVDKIFELSRHDPIGIMIYNTLEFMRVPLELLVKQFRESHHCRPFSSVAVAAEEFFLYLEAEISGTDRDQQNHVCLLSDRLFGLVRKRFEDRVDAAYIDRLKNAKPRASLNFRDIFVHVVKVFTEFFVREPRTPVFSTVDPDDIRARYRHAIKGAIDRNFSDLSFVGCEDEGLLTRLAALALCSGRFSDIRTGFVFAGYGQEQMFPELIAFESDGLIADKIKRRLFKHVTIDRSTTPAEIVPFAQREMVDRFLYGIGICSSPHL